MNMHMSMSCRRMIIMPRNSPQLSIIHRPVLRVCPESAPAVQRSITRVMTKAGMSEKSDRKAMQWPPKSHRPNMIAQK